MNIIIKTFFLSCLKATELMEKKLAMKVSTKERIQLKIHNILCPPCAHYEKQSKLFDECMSKHKNSTPIDKATIESLKESISKKIEHLHD